MPRDPITKVYTPPDGTYGEPGEVIESAAYNAFTEDLANDLSEPLPIEVGGTGASSKETALTSIGGLSRFFISDLMVGMSGFFATSAPPSGWIIANGAEISRATYALLFSKIGTMYGAGNGTSTFNAPDLRGVFVRGWNDDGTVDPDRLLGTGQLDDNKAHGHVGTAASSGAHTHTLTTSRFDLGQPIGNNIIQSGSGINPNMITADTTSSGAHTHDVVISNTGTEFRPKNVALLGCIFAGLN